MDERDTMIAPGCQALITNPSLNEGAAVLGARPKVSFLRDILPAAIIIIAATAIVYSNSCRVPFLFDDQRSIFRNETIRHLWPIGPMLHPPCNGEAVQRRPVVNVSLAINYAIGGVNPWGYHAFNVAYHALAALLLFGIVRRTLMLPCMSSRLQQNAPFLATLIALIWAIHPLQTEAVTYVVQRTEILAGLFFLLTLYSVIRGASARWSTPWNILAVISCALAMGSKESAISAPIIVLLYDRVFLTCSWREVFHRRWALYVGLAACWSVVLLLLPQGKEGTAIFGRDSQVIGYALAQFGAIAHYLRLCFWPRGLTLDYGEYAPLAAWQIIPYAVVIGTLVVGTLLAFRRHAWLGFLGVCFFAILAPSSSVIPLYQQVAAEKRMYLPLAAVITAVVIGVYWLTGSARFQQWLDSTRRPKLVHRVTIALFGLLLVTLGVSSYVRNHAYRSGLTIWEDTMLKCPDNGRAIANLGIAYHNVGLTDDAFECYEKALRRDPKLWIALNNIAILEAERNMLEAAIGHLERAVAIDPGCPEAHNNLGVYLNTCGQTDRAIAQFQQALAVRPDYAGAKANLNRVLADLHTSPKAKAEPHRRPSQ